MKARMQLKRKKKEEIPNTIEHFQRLRQNYNEIILINNSEKNCLLLQNNLNKV